MVRVRANYISGLGLTFTPMKQGKQRGRVWELVFLLFESKRGLAGKVIRKEPLGRNRKRQNRNFGIFQKGVKLFDDFLCEFLFVGFLETQSEGGTVSQNLTLFS